MARQRSRRRGSGESRTPESWSQRVGAFTGLPALIDKLGADPDAVIAATGLPRDALADADNRIPFEACGRLLETASRMTGFRHLGLTAGRMVRLADLGLVGELARNAQSLAEALQFMVAYRHLNSEGDLLFLARNEPIAEVRYAIYFPGLTGGSQIRDYALAAIFGTLRELAGPRWLPSEVFVLHAKPSHAFHHRNLFRVQPHFDAGFCALRFPAYWLDRPVPGADPGRRQRALEAVQRAADPDLLQQVYRALRELLLSGKSSGDDVAGVLSLHRRTLNRRLKARGTTFQHVLDTVRCEAARQLLGHSRLPLNRIAAALGYASISPFTRSFRRWTGASPSDWRKRAPAGRAPRSDLPVGAADAWRAESGAGIPRRTVK